MSGMAVARPRANPRRPRSPQLSRMAPRVGFVLLALAVWQAFAAGGRLGAVPSPVEVGGALGGLFASGGVWAPLAITLAAWAVSFVLSVAVGFAIGFPLGASRLAYRMSAFTLDFLRTIPTLALVPLVILLFGSGAPSTVLLAFFGAVWAVALQTIYGIRDVDPVARDTYRAYRVGRRDRLLLLTLPSAAPYVATGLRLAAAISLLLTLSAEIVIPAPGMGQQIVLAQLGDAVPQMYAYVVLSGLVGVGINAAFVALEHAVLSWHPSQRGEVR